MVASRQLDLEYTKITAPVSGRVSRYIVTVGNLIQSADQANVTLLTTIVSVDPMYAYFDVDERTVLRVRQWIREGKAESARDAGVARVRWAWPPRRGFPTRARSISSTTRSIRKPAPCASGACSPTRTRRSPPDSSPASACPSARPTRPCWSPTAPWTPTRARRSSTSSTTRTRSSPAPFGLGSLHDGLRAIEDGLKAGRAGDRQRPATGSAGHHRRAEARGHAKANPKSEMRNPKQFKFQIRMTAGRRFRLACSGLGLVRLSDFSVEDYHAGAFLHRPPRPGLGDLHRHHPAGGHRRGPPARRPVPGDHAPDRPRDGQLPRGQRPDHRRHGGRADRAAGRGRREDAVHVVAEQQRRLVHPGRDLRAWAPT